MIAAIVLSALVNISVTTRPPAVSATTQEPDDKKPPSRGTGRSSRGSGR